MMYMIYDTQAQFITAMQRSGFEAMHFTGRDLKKMQNPYSDENCAMRNVLNLKSDYKICLELHDKRVIRLMVVTTRDGPMTEEIENEITTIFEPGKFARFSRGFSVRKHKMNCKREAVFRRTKENIVEPISHIAKQSGKVAYVHTVGGEFEREKYRQKREDEASGERGSIHL